MPKFGDPEILKEIDKLARQEENKNQAKPKRKRGRPKKNK